MAFAARGVGSRKAGYLAQNAKNTHTYKEGKSRRRLYPPVPLPLLYTTSHGHTIPYHTHATSGTNIALKEHKTIKSVWIPSERRPCHHRRNIIITIIIITIDHHHPPSSYAITKYYAAARHHLMHTRGKPSTSSRLQPSVKQLPPPPQPFSHPAIQNGRSVSHLPVSTSPALSPTWPKRRCFRPG